MPGICGIITRAPLDDLAARHRRMLDQLVTHDWYLRAAHIFQDRTIALGGSFLGCVNATAEIAANEANDLWAVIDGELYDYDSLRPSLEAAGHRFKGVSHAELLMLGYQSQGPHFFRQLHGKFSAALINLKQQRAILVTDRFGMKPLYFVHTPDRLLFASEIKALLADPALSRQLNYRGIAQFFSYGQLLADDTFLESIRTVPAATCLTYDLQSGSLGYDRYWHPSHEQWTGGDAELLEQIDNAMIKSVTRCTAGAARLGISLSGGLDSRVILADIDHQRTQMTSLSLGVAGSLDHRCARQMAALTNRRHHCHLLGTDFLANFEHHVRQMVHLTDGHYLSQCIVIPTLPVYRQLGIEVLLRGHAGELMHMIKAYNFSLDAEGLAIADRPSLESWLWRHLRAYMLDNVDGQLLAAIDQREMERLARESLSECLEESAAVAPPLQQVWHLFLSQRLRRETALSMVKLGSVVETRLPYLDNELVDLLLAAPPRMKLGDEVQQFMLARHRPEFLEIVNANTGTRIGAPGIVRRLSTLRMKVLARLGTPGYQPYERLGLWLRRELAPLVEQLLLGQRCLSRGVFVPDTVRTVVRQHFDNRRNHTFLLLALMIFELGQRQFFDGDAYAQGTATTEPSTHSFETHSAVG